MNGILLIKDHCIIIFDSFCLVHTTALLMVPVCLALAAYSFYRFLQCLWEIRKDVKENPQIYEQARKNLESQGASPRGRGIILFDLEVARLKKEREEKIKSLYPS